MIRRYLGHLYREGHSDHVGDFCAYLLKQAWSESLEAIDVEDEDCRSSYFHLHRCGHI